MDVQVETELEMVSRHVLRGDAIIANQKIIIERLRSAGASVDEAERLLDSFLDCKTLHLQHLARITG